MKKYFFIATLFFASHIFGQSYQTKQDKPIAYLHATIHTGNGDIIENGIIAFENGKIILLGSSTTMKYDLTKFETIDATGKHIYPGFILLQSFLGLKEIEAVRATNDAYEIGLMNSNVRSIISYNTDSKAIPTLRTNGILLAQIIPGGAMISGTSSVVKLDAWNWQDATIVSDNGMQVQWPNYYEFYFDNGYKLKVSEKYHQQIQNLTTFFDEAKAYCTDENHITKNLKFEAMRNVFSGKTKLYMKANLAKEMVGAILFAKKYEMIPVIVGGNESYQIIDFLKENNVPIVLENVYRMPSQNAEDIDMPYKLPYLLHQAGILCALTLIDGDGYWSQRNLPFIAGTAAAYGLTKEEALQMISINAAKILGIEQTTGSLEIGKDATFIVSQGDVLDIKSSRIEAAYIFGISTEIKNWQNENYEKYSKKYGIEIK